MSTGASAYDKVYDDIMNRIGSQSQEEATAAKNVLAWLTFTKRPLKVEEFSIAVSLEESDSYLDKESLMDIERLVSVCKGLVVVDAQNGTVTLIHATTKEYLNRRLCNWRQDPNAAIATFCLTYLMFPTFDVEFSKLEEYLKREKARAQLYPLLEYSLDYTPLHVRSAMVEPPSIDRFLSSDSKITKNWLLLISKRGKEQGEIVAQWLIEKGVCTRICDLQGRTPLHYAVLNGWKRFVQPLLERGATLQADTENMTPLHYTVKSGAEEIARTFINAGIPVDTPVTRRIYIPGDKDSKVVFSVKDDEQGVVRNSPRKEGLTPLHLAALTGSQRMTKFFLDHGANPNFPSRSGETPLHLAMNRNIYAPQGTGIVDFWNEPTNRLETIFDYMDLYDDDDGDGEESGWVRERRLAIIDLLLESPEVDVNAQDIYGISPLHIAARDQYLSEPVFQKLIDKGANISLRTAKNETLLHVAIANPNDGITSKLLALRADPADKDVNGHNALHKAARKGHLPIVQDILTWTPKSSLQAILESKDHHGQNVLHHLLSSRGSVSVDVTAYLLERVSGINDLDNEGMPPVAMFLSRLAHCAHQSDPDILDHVFRNGADPGFTTAEGLGLVHLAAGSSRLSVGLLQGLARGGVSLTSTDERGRTVLHHASIKGALTEEVWRYLYEEVKLPLEIRDKYGKTALDYAIEKGKEDHGPNLWKPRGWKETERLLRGMEKEA